MDLPMLLVSGAIAGTPAGLLGIGGGIIIVPIVTLLFETQGLAHGLAIKMALGTSLATIIVTAISSIYTHHRKGAVDWHLFKVMAQFNVLLFKTLSFFCFTQKQNHLFRFKWLSNIIIGPTFHGLYGSVHIAVS